MPVLTDSGCNFEAVFYYHVEALAENENFGVKKIAAWALRFFYRFPSTFFLVFVGFCMFFLKISSLLESKFAGLMRVILVQINFSPSSGMLMKGPTLSGDYEKQLS